MTAERIDLPDADAIIVIDSTARGPAFGGIRRRSYATAAAACADAEGLARAMTLKCALARLPAGGAKTVIRDLGGDTGPRYEALGRAIARLGGRYVCGPDLGTGAAELAIVRRFTAHVNPEANDAGASTAAGVVAAMRAAWAVLGREPSVTAIQGLGAVGRDVARRLLARGGRVVGADPDPVARGAARELGVEIVGPDRLLEHPCDVLAPCAHGAVLDAALAGRLRCSAICGSANNQLAGPGAAQALMGAGVLHVPDIVASAGAVIQGVLTLANRHSDVDGAIAAIEQTAAEVLAEAVRAGQTPTRVALRIAESRVTS